MNDENNIYENQEENSQFPQEQALDEMDKPTTQEQKIFLQKAHQFEDNLLYFLDHQDISIAQNILSAKIKEDISSTEDFKTALKAFLKHLNIDIQKDEDVKFNASNIPNIKSNVLFEALLEASANILSYILPSGDFIKCHVSGQGTEQTDEIASRVSAFFNYYNQVLNTDFEKDIKTTIMWSVIAGYSFVKIEHDKRKNLPIILPIRPHEIAFDKTLVSQSLLERFTHIYKLNKAQFKEKVRNGSFVDFNAMPTKIDDEIQEDIDTMQGIDRENVSVYEIWECHVNWYFASEKYRPFLNGKPLNAPLPYIISFDAGTKQILSIRRNWKIDGDPQQAIQHFVRFDLMPSLTGNGLGMMQYCSYIDAINMLDQEIVKSAIYSNNPRGFKASNIDNNSVITVNAGEFVPINTNGQSMNTVIQELSSNPPNQSLIDCKNALVEAIKKPFQIINNEVTKMSTQAPMGSTLAMLESLQKVPNLFVKNAYSSFGQVLNLLKHKFFEWIPEGKMYPFFVAGGNQAVVKGDFSDSIKIQPIVDPSLSSSAYKLMRAELIINNALKFPQIHDANAVCKYYYQALNISDSEIEKILPPQNIQQQLEGANAQLAESTKQIEQLQLQLQQMSQTMESPEMIQAKAFAHDVDVKQQSVEKDMLKIQLEHEIGLKKLDIDQKELQLKIIQAQDKSEKEDTKIEIDAISKGIMQSSNAMAQKLQQQQAQEQVQHAQEKAQQAQQYAEQQAQQTQSQPQSQPAKTEQQLKRHI